HRLIGLAEAAGSFLIEDDYDSEFRFKGSPVPPLLALAPERVIHVGTFSKTLAPGLRLGFVVIPPALVDRFRQTKDALTLLTPNAEQRALAAMLASGDFERHLYRMVKVYRHKRGVLKEALETHFPGMLDIRGDDAGMHLLARFRTVAEPDDAAAAGLSERPEAGLRGSPDTGRHEPSEADPSRVKILRNLHDVKWENAVSFGVRIQCADDYRLAGGGLRRDLVFGCGHLSAADIREGVARLAAFLKEAAGQDRTRDADNLSTSQKPQKSRPGMLAKPTTCASAGRPLFPASALPRLRMIVPHHVEGGGAGVRFHLLHAFRAGDDAGHRRMLQAPGQRPLRHADAFRHFRAGDFLHQAQLFV